MLAFLIVSNTSLNNLYVLLYEMVNNVSWIQNLGNGQNTISIGHDKGENKNPKT